MVSSQTKAFPFHPWEVTQGFDPTIASRPYSVSWVNSSGSPLAWEMAANAHITDAFVSSVVKGEALADVSMLAFRDPDRFVAGELHRHAEAWSRISSLAPCHLATQVLPWIENCVDVHDFFKPFKGSYKGEEYDSALPPQRIFLNHPSCKPFVDFISSTVLGRLSTGAISLWGKVGEVDPPHLVMPLTVEPTKPRLCNDNRFLNLWIADRPFQLDHLRDIVRYTPLDSFQTICDDKSGYDHIFLKESSRKYFGFQWGGWFFTSNCIPFGWKSSAYIYHSTGLLASHYFRSLGIPCSLYIDDRHTGQLRLDPRFVPTAYQNLNSPKDVSLSLAKAAIFVVCFTLVSLGYFLGLKKSILVPSIRVPYLGFISDSHLQAFTLLPSKKAKFLDLLKSALSSSQIELLPLQKLAGKCVSMSLAVPAARLFTNEINLAISRASRSARPVRLLGPLRAELEHWLFLESWEGFLPWRSEFHRQVTLYSDASRFAWGGSFPGAFPRCISDYWDHSSISYDIAVKETLALANVLSSVKDSIRDSRVDVFVDSQALISAWERQGSRSPALFRALKQVFVVSSPLNVDLRLFYIPSADNIADLPSRRISRQDAMLSSPLWDSVQSVFGGLNGHSVDLMALPSNVQHGLDGSPLPFFAPFPVPGCSGVNLFAQDFSQHRDGRFSNPYVFPPIALISPVLRFLSGSCMSFTIVVPDVSPRKYWWPLLRATACDSFLLAPKGALGAVLVPSKGGFSSHWPLPWDLWVFRVCPSQPL